mmetsp:Transcript_25003/g.54388  ORF Transcript_25003/g.54388 Transcript_25003/m.54388 type:complete len:384 (-) Transcript_25003:106-1257(-)
MALELEVERVQVSESMSLLWHRPPIEEVEQQARDPETVRVFLNGCFDLMHVGHFNALRQAKSLFYQKGYKKVVLVAGLHSDEAIAGQKGPPLLSEQERMAVLKATKWVDEMATDLPYVSMSSRMADALRVQWICHGDDMPICKGGDGMYSDIISANRFQILKRTEGISTTQIMNRLLSALENCEASPTTSTAWATSQRLTSFFAPANPWTPARSLSDSSCVVYVAGTFELLHAGHIELLQKAASLGDYLLVGVHADDIVTKRTGNEPVLTMLERVMSLLSLSLVDDVVLGAPWEVNQDLLTTMNISIVVAADADSGSPSDTQTRLAVAKQAGLIQELQLESKLTSGTLHQRVAERREALQNRNSTLLQKEAAYVHRREYVPEM